MRKAWVMCLIGMVLDSTILHHATNVLYHPTPSIYLISHHEVADLPNHRSPDSAYLTTMRILIFQTYCTNIKEWSAVSSIAVGAILCYRCSG
ncbi:hypothetical protein EDB82DRAFT_23087 [Fusarium venenatum]|uniref:uncharacterized protein n=1 Tax=Fusarium venenatum TaxID=56646 RepID=UPI001D64007A|nr:hypothetical protein EDB82DRAFT_23087 [Fusarium venenatum]